MSNNLTENNSLNLFFNRLDRSLFLNEDYKELAERDRPLPIGYGQTISQPSLVCWMTQLLDLDKSHKVLEIGTGSGYQTAFLAEFSAQVYTVERIAALSNKAQIRLAELGYSNIQYKIGDGSEGWNEFAPYDRIIVTAGAGNLPEPLVNQLKLEGRMLIPVGIKEVQELLLVQKDETGKVTTEPVDRVIFVELHGKYGWPDCN